MVAVEKLAEQITANYDNPLRGSIDVPAQVESLLQSLGATSSDSGGKVTYYGADPITPDRLPYGSISAISLAAKAILVAKIWKERTGEGQTSTSTCVNLCGASHRSSTGSGNWSMDSPDAPIHTAHFPTVRILWRPEMASGLCSPKFIPPCGSVASISSNRGAARMRRCAMR